MPKDYAHRGQFKVRKKPHPNSFPWFPIIILIVFIAVIVTGIYLIRAHYYSLNSIASSKGGGAVVQQAKPVFSKVSAKQKKRALDQTQEQPPVKFDFYNQLPEMKINSSDTQSSTNKVSAVQNPSKYVLQLASLTSQPHADVFKTLLNNKGFKSRMIIANQGGVILYRIQMGPFNNQQAAKAMQDQLQQKHISSILIKAS